MTVRARAVAVLHVGRHQRRPMVARRDDEVDADLGAGHSLQRFLDEARETIFEPVLRELARDTYAECAAVRRHDRRVLSHMSYVRLASWKRSSSWTCDQI